MFTQYNAVNRCYTGNGANISRFLLVMHLRYKYVSIMLLICYTISYILCE